ncbi:hypothetical protein PNEG_02851 [Pneumocystis murina B123]|uniref:dynamin GTPase n=1 Tax=Pneumocystis murina (strain B123) TaxID=1069680 RepID=M7PDY0_PNEMU|nr:hypothetical protein PNEG_02851 [Pneumocystis murina B123]EMR08674.1 hypothetical protein PNEG_02851 [Pneumocystis murina B123]
MNKNMKQRLIKGFNNVLNGSQCVSITRISVFSLISKIVYKILRIFIVGGFLFFGGINYLNYKIEVFKSYFNNMFNYYINLLKTILECIKQDILSKIGVFIFKKTFLKCSLVKEDSFISGLYDIILSSYFSLNLRQRRNDEICMLHNTSDNSQTMLLTKGLIEIRNILQQIKQNEKFALPNIVVIGSQSSGKSSVLEAIIGREFLPKGTDMVTRRPIELTLVHTFESDEYGEFPDLGQKKVSFDQIQKVIADLNYSVSENDYISDEPIRLNIFSPNVPDLTFIDLPGYIQIQSKDQPSSLKDRIVTLCKKYIQEPNIILAVSSADVDLANSVALHASREVDPHGIRTIGVVTKMDLVTPERGFSILKNMNYPLNLGYVGVISKFSQSFFDKNINVSDLIDKNEKEYFSNFCEFSNNDCFFGISTLKKKLIQILEDSMVQNLQNIYGIIRLELEQVSYQLKVEYNDRFLTQEVYMAELVDILKYRFKKFVENFGKSQIRLILKDILNQKALDLLAERYWLDQSIYNSQKMSFDDIYWKNKLDTSISSLTKLGIGSLVTGLLTSIISSEMEKISQENQFKVHPYVRQCIVQSTQNILKEKYHCTVEQVEKSIKPYKYEIDVDDDEWELGRKRSQEILKKEIKMCQDAFRKLKETIGSKKIEKIVNLIITGKNDYDSIECSKSLIEKGQQAIFLKNRENILNTRLKFVKSKKCKSVVNKYYCPEIFLEIVVKKLVDISVPFLDVELFSEFVHKFPRDLDNRLIYNLTSEQLEKIVNENFEIKKQIDLQKKKALLELALNKIESFMLSKKMYCFN